MYFHPSEMISFSLQGDVKLAKFGLYHMTDHGADVDFPVGYVTSFHSSQGDFHHCLSGTSCACLFLVTSYKKERKTITSRDIYS